MKEKIFVDTNILIYAHDKKSPQKREIASRLLESLWDMEEKPYISVQVLQEFFVNISRFLTYDEVSELMEIYKNWNVIDNSLSVFEKAVLIYRKHKLSFWDSLIVSAAVMSGSKILFTEDLSHGQKIESVKIINPFME
ncbi:MAG TPA: PIN domain-containing protein [Leptospiraceae bacterium]|nr:PIN domain-containing protein [Leptospiraceae bacterium]HMY67957.1 PIN domain-containing protein [Leptospiraceae bacterium]HMZ58062.1 PIN domain-containing protein [Leptospiraceae bacterium]HNF13483.1 PIN domain-containing protein [Leptospiraceae bacterium]HNF27784.1 PIN domain-containing protein [Leptospiraceae bacterium]